MKRYHVCGLGNAIVDLFLELPDAEFEELGFERGTMRLVEHDDQSRLVERVHRGKPALAAGGSVANSLIALTQLGGRAANICCIGDDRHGEFYRSEFAQLGVALAVPPVSGEPTGTSVVLVTPDAERTMRTCLAVSAQLSADHVAEEIIAESEWLFVEGYVLANPTGPGAALRAVEVARRHGTKVAVTCSDAFIPAVFGGPLRDILGHTDLLFANAAEAMALTGAADVEGAAEGLKGVVPNAVVTDGPGGAYVRWHGAEAHAPAVPCEPVDLTGAGDMFAGAFLYGVTHGFDPAASARAANALCAKVIGRVGARLESGTRAEWDLAVA